MELQETRELLKVIKSPIISDKATRLLEQNKYTFLVEKTAPKPIIKNALEYLFNVQVKKINTLKSAIKKRSVGRFTGNKTQYKKVIITLEEGQQINLFPET